MVELPSLEERVNILVEDSITGTSELDSTGTLACEIVIVSGGRLVVGAMSCDVVSGCDDGRTLSLVVGLSVPLKESRLVVSSGFCDSCEVDVLNTGGIFSDIGVLDTATVSEENVLDTGAISDENILETIESCETDVLEI